MSMNEVFGPSAISKHLPRDPIDIWRRPSVTYGYQKESPRPLRSRLTPLNVGDRSTQSGMASLKATNAGKRVGVVNHCPLDVPGPWH